MGIALVISDVDGTLVTGDKRLTPATIAAVAHLDRAGIAFTLVSSRPPVGLRDLARALRLRLPLGAYNGASVVGPDLAPIAETLLPPDAAREAAERLVAAGIDAWVFARGGWHLRDPGAPYADLERRTLGIEPNVVADLDPLLAAASKVVGVSRDAACLARIEVDLGARLEGRANVHRSQPYYLDVTPPGLDKGAFVAGTARRLGIPLDRVATLGDAGNDVAMFRIAGLAIAMGNAAPDVQRAASLVVADNDADGFAEAVDRILAPR